MTTHTDAAGYMFETTVVHGIDVVHIRDPKGNPIAPLPKPESTR